MMERRREERIIIELLDLLSAEFEIGNGVGIGKLWHLSVRDCSEHGLGLLVSENDYELLQILDPGDKIKDMVLYTEWAMTRVDAIVRHITKIEWGTYIGQYILGVEVIKFIDVPKLMALKRKTKNIVEYVHKVSFFQNFTKKQIDEICKISTITKFLKGKVIITEGEIDDTFYIILRGRARIRKKDRDVATVDVGECFGEMACIGGQPRSATVLADSDCIVMKISAPLIDKSSEKVKLQFYQNFAKTLVKRLSAQSEI